jgi:tetratricopeptide (TPR) repeat protein
MVRSALQIRKAVLGADDLSLGLDYNALMAILRARRDYDGALAAAQEAARIARVTGGPYHHQLEVNLAAVGTLYTLMGRPREALAPLAEAIRINERIRSPEHLQTATARGSYGEALARSGNWLEGAAQLRRAIRSFEQADMRDPEFESATIAKLARLQLERGDPVSALGLFQAMGRSAQTRGARGVNQQARAAAGEARSLAALGRNEAAAAALTRARALTVDLTPSDAELQIDLQLLDALMALRNGDMALARQGLGQSQLAMRSLPYPPAFLSPAVAEIEGLLR